MPTRNEDLPAQRDSHLRHYWLREDFDHLMNLLGGEGFVFPSDRDSSSSLAYPKSTEGAFRELRMRGLKCDGAMLIRLVEDGVVNPCRGQALMTDERGEVKYGPSDRVLFWGKEHIDAAAEWLYENDYWGSWTHFCFVANLRFGQAVKAHRVACARYGLPFQLSFDVPGFLTIVEPAKNAVENYATVRFFPGNMTAEVAKK